METQTNGLSKAEAEIYDRQIRLWGVEAQKKIQSSKILVLGLNGIGAEISKNLILAGLNVLIRDKNIATEEDLAANFYIDHDLLAKGNSPRDACSIQNLKNLNPLATVDLLSSDIFLLSNEDLKFLSAVVVCDVAWNDEISPGEYLTKVNALCREHHVNFISALSFGISSVAFFDLGNEYKYKMKKKVTDKEVNREEISVHEAKFISLQEILELSWKENCFPTNRRKKIDATFYAFLCTCLLTDADIDLDLYTAKFNDLKADKDFKQGMFEDNEVLDYIKHFLARSQISPVCAVMGGVVGQEIVKIVSGTDKPIDNFFVLNCMNSEGKVHRIG